jgi:hypothetical protein
VPGKPFGGIKRSFHKSRIPRHGKSQGTTKKIEDDRKAVSAWRNFMEAHYEVLAFLMNARVRACQMAIFATDTTNCSRKDSGIVHTDISKK